MSNFIKNHQDNTGNRWNPKTYEQNLLQLFEMNSDEFSNYLYGILSFLPEYWFNIIQSIFRLPDFSTCIRKREKLLSETPNLSSLCQNLDFTETSDFENLLQNYIEFYWGSLDELKDNRVLLVIDAAALSCNGGYNPKTGKTIGFVNTRKQQTFKNLEEYRPLKSEIAKSVFVVMLCPLDPKLKPLIINRNFKTSGSATKDEISLLKSLSEALVNLKFQYIGTASDGDHQFYHFSCIFANIIIEIPNGFLNIPLYHFIEMSGQIPWFQDVLHILKNERYHLISKQPIRILPSCGDLIISYEQFEKALETLPKNVFNNSQATKMVDSLAIDLFDWNTVKDAMIKNDLLTPILLPPALLYQVFYNKKLDRNQRYHYLNMGAAIVFIHFYSFQIYGNANKGILPINQENMAKYLLLAASIAPLFRDSRPFDLADCTSHLLEHFFGLIRRLCSGNNSKERFEFALKKALCMQAWAPKIKLENKISGREAPDSAAVVEEGKLAEKYENLEFGKYVNAAYSLFVRIFVNHNLKFPFTIPGVEIGDYDVKVINYDLKTFEISTSRKYPTTFKNGDEINSNGYINYRQHSESNQANKI